MTNPDYVGIPTLPTTSLHETMAHASVEPDGVFSPTLTNLQDSLNEMAYRELPKVTGEGNLFADEEIEQFQAMVELLKRTLMM